MAKKPPPDQEERFAITPLGLLHLTIGPEAARKAIDALELYVRRNFVKQGQTGAIVLDDITNQFTFTPLCRATDDEQR